MIQVHPIEILELVFWISISYQGVTFTVNDFRKRAQISSGFFGVGSLLFLKGFQFFHPGYHDSGIPKDDQIPVLEVGFYLMCCAHILFVISVFYLLKNSVASKLRERKTK